ncbi:MAG: hypothetical protein KAT70_00180 [Thermoplasmata archaeon]|nr:hypothetical protein [Thermoplasmata archaeon]
MVTGGAKAGRKDWEIIAICAVLQGIIDIDHLFLPSSGMHYLHNVTMAFSIPILLFVTASIPRPTTFMSLIRKIGLLWAVVGLGHLSADMWTGGIFHPLFPFSNAPFIVPSPGAAQVFQGTYLTTNDIMLGLWAVMVLLAHVAYSTIAEEMRAEEALRRADLIWDLDSQDISFPEEAFGRGASSFG